MPDPDSASPIEIAFLERFLRDREGGVERSLADYQALFPGHEQLVAAAHARATAVDAGEDEEGGRDLDAGEAGSERFAHFRLLRRLGQGGQGVVWLAEDERLQRRVALKLLSTSLLWLDEQQQQKVRARFEREAAVAARLDDPGLCKVHEVGEYDGVPWISMQFVDGESLDRRFAAGAGSGTEATSERVRRVVAVVEAAARAVHEAHEVGLVHRDLKPGNIMVTPRDRVVVLDFGIAYDDDANAALTATGQALGSPAYMAPEQIAGAAAVDRRVDVYALGVTLFEGLAGRRPFDEPTRERLFEQIRNGVAPRLRSTTSVSSDLEVVVACAMDRSPERRYRTCLEFADDLGRVLRHEPIRARPASTTTKAVRWAQRNPIVATMGMALFVLVASLAAVFAYESHRRGELVLELSATNEDLAAKTREAQAARDLATQNERAADWQAYLANVRAASLQRKDGEVRQAIASLEACAPELRGFEWRYEMLRCNGYSKKLFDGVVASAVDPSGRMLAVGRDGGDIEIVDASSHEPLRTIATGRDLTALGFGPRGRLLAAGFRGARPRAFAVATGEIVLDVTTPVPQGHRMPITRKVAVSESATWLAALLDSDMVAIWDRDGSPVANVSCADMAFFDGGRLAIARQEGVQTVDLASQQRGTFDAISCAAVDAVGDGSRLAIGTTKGELIGYDLAASEKRSFRAHRAAIELVRRDPATNLVASYGADQWLRVHDLMVRRLESWTRLAERPRSLWFCRDSDGLIVEAAGSLFEYCTWGEVGRWGKPGYPVAAVLAGRDEGTLLLVGQDGRIEKLDAMTFETLAMVGRNHTMVLAADRARHASLLVTGDAGGEARIWSVDECKLLRVCAGRETHWDGEGVHRFRRASVIDDVAISSDGAIAAAVFRKAATVLYDVATGERLRRLPPELAVRGVDFVPGTRQLVLVTSQGARLLADVEAPLGEPFSSTPAESEPRAPSVSPDGRWVAAASDDGVLLWSLADRAFVGRLGGGVVECVAFDPSVQRLAAGYRGGAGLRLFDTATGDEVYSEPELRSTVGSLRFSPDGSRLFTGSGELGVVDSQRASLPELRARGRARRTQLSAMTRVQPLFHQHRLLDVVLEHLAGMDLEESERAACEAWARRVGNNVDWLYTSAWSTIVTAAATPDDYAHALRCAEECVRLASSRPSHLLLLGAAQYRLDRLDEARDTILRALRAARFEPTLRGPAKIFLAMAMARLGDVAAAESLLAVAEKVKWSVANGHYRGLLLDEARTCLSRHR